MCALIAKSSGNFTPAPEGLWPAVCVDVVDLGQVKQVWNGKEKSAHKCRIVWEISELMASGKPFIVSKRYTLSLHEKAQLHKDLKTWRGQAFTPEELEGFDIEKVLGKPCNLVIVHTEKDGMVYGNVQTVMRAKGVPLVSCGTYVRVKDRPPTDAAAPVGNPDYSDHEPFD